MTNPLSNRIPPHRLDAELGICGVCILDPDRIPDLRRPWFDTIPGARLFEALTELAAKKAPIDTATVTEALAAKGVQEAGVLVEDAIAKAPTKHNLDYWRAILEEQAARRNMIDTGERLIALAYNAETPVGELLDKFESEALEVRKAIAGGVVEESDIPTILAELVDDYEAAANGTRSMGLATGFAALDRLTRGLRPGQLFVLAARPSVGKTALALNIAENLAVHQGVPVGFWTLEMTTKELLHRLTCLLAEMDSADLHAGRITEAEIAKLNKAQTAIRGGPLHIVDRGGMTIGQLAASARRMVQRHHIRLAVVDYLGLLRCGEKRPNRYEETTMISNALKTMAKELGIPVLALAQLNRDPERDNRQPRLGDLRDSGAIEQDADMVGLLHRKSDATGDALEVDLFVAKNRNGRLGNVPLTFESHLCRFKPR